MSTFFFGAKRRAKLLTVPHFPPLPRTPTLRQLAYSLVDCDVLQPKINTYWLCYLSCFIFTAKDVTKQEEKG
jgi:hypothetical protein